MRSRERRFTPRFLLPVFLAVLLLPIGNQILTLRSLRSIHEQQTGVQQTQDVLSRIQAVHGALVDAETGVRGFALTEDREQLDTYREAIRELPNRMEALQFVARTGEQQERVSRLSRLVDERVVLLRDLARQTEKNAPREVILPLVDRGKQLMDEIRAAMDAMADFETAEYQRRAEAAARGLRNAEWALHGMSLVTLIALFTTGILLRRQLTAQRKQEWLSAALSELNMVTRRSETIDLFCTQTLEQVTRLLDVPVAAFFVRERGEFTLAAGVALPPNASKRLAIGEGAVGEAISRQEPLVLSDAQKIAHPIVTGLERLQPAQGIVLPIVHDGDTIGVIELSSLAPFVDLDVEVLKALMPAIAVALQAVVSRSKLQSLLEETQAQSEELQAQQEELRNYTDQLEKRSAALLQAQHELQAQQEELRQTNEELEQQARALEQHQGIVNLRNQELLRTKDELEEKAHQLSTASQYKSQFLANMSHELRTPLNSLLILSTMLADNRGGRLSPEEVEFARTINNSGNDLLMLINDILDLAKVESGNLHLEIGPVSVASVVENLKRTYAAAAADKKLLLEVQQFADADLTLNTDRLRVEQILRNFLSNALKFTEQGSIRLTAAREGEWVHFAVEDTGIGIPADKLEHVFEAFQQADGTTSRKFGGTGLGLTISRELATALGGRIELHSEVGKGSRFSLFVPFSPALETAPAAAMTEVSEKPAPRREATPLPNLPESERYLLIVEDDEAFSKTLLKLAEEAGFTAALVHDGDTALAAIEKRPPIGILLDVKLPTVSGLAVLENVKSNPKTRHIPVHMISGVDHTANAMRLGAMGYLVKPATRDKVLQALERVSTFAAHGLKRVLIVEDDQLQRQTLTQLIQAASVQCESVGNGGDAMARILEGGVDCVILDLNLPDMSGFEFLQRLEAEQTAPLPPVVVYTGKDLTRKEAEELRRYSDSIIIKGARSPERLLEEVNLFLHQLESESSTPAVTRPMNAQFQGRRLLLADDDLRNTFALMSALEPEGFEITVARNGKEALAALEADPTLELVLMDIMMPEMDGLEATRLIRANPRTRNMPVLALTAKAMKEDQEKCLEAGASDYLTKPFKLDHLFSLLRVWLPDRILRD
jgi:CheY-like chemotaxis protein/signal transduction histidine kinase